MNLPHKTPTIKTIVTDFSKVLLFPKDANYHGGMNALNNQLLADNPSYPFSDYFVLNDELLEYYRQLNAKVPVYVFTSETIQDHPAIKSRVQNAFRGVLSAKKLQVSKANGAAYQAIAKVVDCRPDEIIYIDDKEANIKTAAAAGLKALLYTSNSKVIAKVNARVAEYL